MIYSPLGRGIKYLKMIRWLWTSKAFTDGPSLSPPNQSVMIALLSYQPFSTFFLPGTPYLLKTDYTNEIGYSGFVLWNRPDFFLIK